MLPSQHVWIGKQVPLQEIFSSFTGGIHHSSGRSLYIVSGARGWNTNKIIEFLIYKQFELPPTHRWIGYIDEIKQLLWNYERFKEVIPFADFTASC